MRHNISPPIMEYVNEPLDTLSSSVMDKLDSVINKSIDRIDNLPVRFQVYSGGLVIYMTKSFAYRQDCITQIHGKTMADCIEQLKGVHINEAGVLATETYRLESTFYDMMREKLAHTPHINLIDHRCAVCYNYTPHTADGHQHPLCNRCILRVNSCPICRQKILLESELVDSDGTYYTSDDDVTQV